MPRRFRGSTKPVHPVTWFGTDFIVDVNSTSGVNVLDELVGSATFEVMSSPTVVRVVGWLESRLSQTTDDGTARVCEFTYGIRVIDDQVVAAGSLNLGSELIEPWMYLTGAQLFINVESQITFTSAGAFTTNITRGAHQMGHFRRWDIDIPVMRRVPKGNRLALCYTLTDMTANAQLTVAAQFRILVQE